MELEEDDTIFKCVSVLQARTPPLTSSSSLVEYPTAMMSGMGTTRGHSLREGLMGLKRCVLCSLDVLITSPCKAC